MTFTQAITSCLSKYATFSGRATRSEYWWFYLFVILLVWLATIVSSLMFLDDPAAAEILPMIVNLAFAVPILSAGSRRLHDIGRSGWWQLLVLTIIGVILLIIWWATDSKAEGDRFNTEQDNEAEIWLPEHLCRQLDPQYPSTYETQVAAKRLPLSFLRFHSTRFDVVLKCLIGCEVLGLRVVGTARCVAAARLGHFHGFRLGKDCWFTKETGGKQ